MRSFRLTCFVYLQSISIFIRICTTGEAPVDPPEEMANALAEHQKAHPKKSKKQQRKPSEPDRLDELNNELKSLQYNDGDKPGKSEEIKGEEQTFEEVSNEAGHKTDDGEPSTVDAKVEENAGDDKEVSTVEEKTSGDVARDESNGEK
jgi:Fic family protein